MTNNGRASKFFKRHKNLLLTIINAGLGPCEKQEIDID